MNREIKFRGKGIEEYDKDKWYYGSYFIYNAINYFCLDDGSRTKEIDGKIKSIWVTVDRDTYHKINLGDYYNGME